MVNTCVIERFSPPSSIVLGFDSTCKMEKKEMKEKVKVTANIIPWHGTCVLCGQKWNSTMLLDVITRLLALPKIVLRFCSFFLISPLHDEIKLFCHGITRSFMHWIIRNELKWRERKKRNRKRRKKQRAFDFS